MEFSSRVFECAIALFDYLSSSCDLSEFLEGMIRLILRALTMTENAMLFKITINLLARAMQKDVLKVREKLYELRANGKAKHEVPALLGSASCPGLDETEKTLICMLLAGLNEQFERIFNQSRPPFSTSATQEKLEKIVASFTQAVARREQLRKVLQAAESLSAEARMKPSSPATVFQMASESPIEDMPDKVCFSQVRTVDPKAQKRPCRKCSRSSCSRVESAPCEFKVCNGCRLAVYCSRGELSEPFARRGKPSTWKDQRDPDCSEVAACHSTLQKCSRDQHVCFLTSGRIALTFSVDFSQHSGGFCCNILSA